MSVNIQNIKIELKSLENEGNSLHDTYQRKWQEWQKNPMTEDDVKKMKNEFHDIMDRQLRLTSGTLAIVGRVIDELERMKDELELMKDELERMKDELERMKDELERMKVTVDDLNNEKVRVEFLRNYRDWLGRFFRKLKTKLGRNNWREVKEAIDDYCYEKVDVSGRQCVISLNNILSNINMVFKDIVLLIEMKGDSNNTFHQGWQNVDEIKEQLKNQQFPVGMEKYKDSLQSLANASNTWVAWR